MWPQANPFTFHHLSCRDDKTLLYLPHNTVVKVLKYNKCEIMMKSQPGNSIHRSRFLKVCNKRGISSEERQFTTYLGNEILFEVVYLICLECIFPVESQKKCRGSPVLRNLWSCICLSFLTRSSSIWLLPISTFLGP